jgi:hypothetical protein
MGIVKDLMPPGTKNDVLERLRGLVSRAKNEALSPEQAMELAKSAVEREAANLYAKYQQRLAAFEPTPTDDLGRSILAAVDIPVVAGDATVAVAGLKQVGVVAEQVGEDLVNRRNREGEVRRFCPGQRVSLPDSSAERFLLGRQIDEDLRDETSVRHEALPDDFGRDGIQR